MALRFLVPRADIGDQTSDKSFSITRNGVVVRVHIAAYSTLTVNDALTSHGIEVEEYPWSINGRKGIKLYLVGVNA